MKIKKIPFVIVCIILVIALALPIFMIAKSEIEMNILISDTKKALNKISAYDLECKLKEKFKNTKLYINDDTTKTTICKYKDIDEEIFRKCSYNDKETSNLSDWVCAVISDRKSKKGVIIPIFKVNKFQNGKFKTIEYKEIPFLYGSHVYSVVSSTFSEYGVKSMSGYSRFDRQFAGYRQVPKQIGREIYDIEYKDKDYAIDIIYKMANMERKEYCITYLDKKRSSTIWGLLK